MANIVLSGLFVLFIASFYEFKRDGAKLGLLTLLAVVVFAATFAIGEYVLYITDRMIIVVGLMHSIYTLLLGAMLYLLAAICISPEVEQIQN